MSVFVGVALAGFVPAAQCTAYGAPAPRSEPVLIAGGATEDATASNNQVKVLHAFGGLIAAFAGTASGGATGGGAAGGGTAGGGAASGVQPGGAQVYLAASRDGGAHWSVLTQASSGSVPSRLPTLALDGRGRLHVVWTRYDDGVGKIYYRLWSGGWTGPQQRISPPSGYAGYPALALDQSAQPQVVWYGIREGGSAYTPHQAAYEIYSVGLDRAGWSPPRLISADLPDAVNPAMAAGPEGHLHAVWYQYDRRAYQLRYAERDRAWRSPQGVLKTTSDELAPDVAVDSAGHVSVVWEHHDGGASVIEYAQRAGGQWSGPAVLSDGASPAHHPFVTVSASGEPYVLWDQDDGEIYLRRQSSGRWQPAVRLTTGGGNTFPSGAADGAGIAVIWTHTAGASGVYFLRAAFR